jgi:hypothetical protein
MISRDKKRYIELDKRFLPIFHQPFWLNAVLGNNWDVVFVEKNNEIVASLPFSIQKRRLGLYSTMPPFTQFLGPYFHLPEAKYTTRLSSEISLLNEMIEALPVFSYFEQNWNYEIQNWLPFYWKGYKQTTKFTYVLNNIHEHDLLWDGLKENIRREIRKAEKNNIKIVTGLNYNDFIKVIGNITLYKKFRINETVLKAVFDSCENQNCSLCHCAKDEHGNILSVIFVVWDNQKAYYIIGGKNPGFDNSGAASLLFWDTIKWVSGKVPVFDFEGSMIPAVELYFRSFGGKQMPYNLIYKSKQKWMDVIRNLR